MLVVNAEIDGRNGLGLRCGDGLLVEVGVGLQANGDELVIDAHGGAVIAGLHDHHLHLLALAAARNSVACGPGDTPDAESMRRALAAAPVARDAQGWIRAVGYHEAVAGQLTRELLDGMMADRPLRVQHRSGAAWVFNSAACRMLKLDAADHVGVERDSKGRATGRLFRGDQWLREQLGPGAAPDLSQVGAELASVGVTGVTDATPSNGADEAALFGRALADGSLPQRLTLMGGFELGDHGSMMDGIETGAVKLVLDERALPAIDELAADMSRAHDSARAVAVHCVTRVELFLALAAFEQAGVVAGDRLEHASVCPDEAVQLARGLGLAVVTQPGFVRSRGDAYLREVERSDHPLLYRCRAFVDGGVTLGAGTDAPFGDADPWLAMQAAVDRQTSGGHSLGVDESLTPEQALALFTGRPQNPGGPPRLLAAGEPADLVVLDRQWSRARDELSSSMVRTTVTGGRVSFARD